MSFPVDLIAVVGAGAASAAVWAEIARRIHAKFVKRLEAIKAKPDSSALEVPEIQLEASIGRPQLDSLRERRPAGVAGVLPPTAPDPNAHFVAALADLKATMIAESRKSAIWGFVQNFVFFLLGLGASYFLQ